ncbi:MAG: hypothetical protein QG599_3122 [Pseudomonadota bacterium]|nr:hypothetical protein [Pseudomonadota bacterium]
MKAAFRLFFVLVVTILVLPVTIHIAIAGENNPSDSTKTEIDADQAAGWAKFASEIAQYGKAQQDPIALISAARMLKESRIKEVATVADKASNAPASSRPAANAIKEWLDEARKIAETSDKNKAEILALADEVGKKTRGYYTRHYYYRYHPTCY